MALSCALAGCASASVTLLEDAGGSTGSVAVFDAETGGEVGALTDLDTRARLGGPFRIEPVPPGTHQGLLAYLPPPPRTYVLYFLEGTTELTAESAPILGALREAVTEASDVQIIGHTDAVGSHADNDSLSLDRAREVREALLALGLPVANARVTGRGEREPRTPTADGVADPANRRVEVILR
ncbi:MAG: OmpA family protein [Pseudomonadota bacterium]|jgi:hypothetical protein